jgi:hypothetical protein
VRQSEGLYWVCTAYGVFLDVTGKNTVIACDRPSFVVG